MTSSHKKLAELLKSHKSLTEWLEDIKHQKTNKLKSEDNDKRERLLLLNKLIGLPCERIVKFTGKDLAEKSVALTTHLHKHGGELCALRLIPLKPGLPKLRMRGKTVLEAYEWFKEQEIDASKYRADYIEHPPDHTWSTIFIVNPGGIFGEIIWGGHQQLTQGYHDSKKPVVFTYDYEDWKLSEDNPQLKRYLTKALSFIHISDRSQQEAVKEQLDSSFSHDYLNGYFETADASTGLRYIDYNQSLGALYRDFKVTKLLNDKTHGQFILKGVTASAGVAKGEVQIVHTDELSSSTFKQGNILVCKVTSPDYLPLMQLASAIVTDQGGILSHAAIIAREMKKPCVVGTGEATKKLANKQIVTVDANAGVVL